MKRQNVSSVIRQKGESKNGCFKKTKHVKFLEKRTFLTLIRTRMHAYQGVKNVRFFEKFDVLYFLETPVLSEIVKSMVFGKIKSMYLIKTW